MVQIKRAYEPAAQADGTRILVDRLWPRGVSRGAMHIAKWMKELGPSDELRGFFGHDPARWAEFQKRYRAELRGSAARAMLEEIAGLARRGTVTLVYSARDREHNQAVVIKNALDAMLKPGPA